MKEKFKKVFILVIAPWLCFQLILVPTCVIIFGRSTYGIAAGILAATIVWTGILIYIERNKDTDNDE